MYSPKRVIQILSGSRSGSSLLKSVLSQSPDITSLAGEEEPYFKMSGTGFGLTSNSDSFTKVVNPQLFRQLISEELTTEEPWKHRLSIQFHGQRLANLLEDVSKLEDPKDWLRERGIWGHYDGCSKPERLPFTEMTYEMPPYILPKQQIRLTDTLLLKAPYNLFRPGVMEQIYPEAEFSYVHLYRNPAATINGLIDGWKANYGFHKHLTPYGWWKFEAPAGWESYVHKTVSERSWFQWQAGATTLINRQQRHHVVRFEQLITEPNKVVSGLCRWLEIETPKIATLPQVMSTETPTPFRWKNRRNVIEPLLSNSSELIRQLDYEDRLQWI